MGSPQPARAPALFGTWPRTRAGILAGIRHKESLLRAVGWSVRFASIAVVGLLTFADPPTEAGGAGTQSVVFPVACLGVLCWLTAELRAELWADLWAGLPAAVGGVLLPGSLGLVIVAGCVGAAAGGGGDSLIALAVGALVVAGSDLRLTVVLALAGAGLMALEISGVAFGQGVGTLVGFPLLLAIGMLIGRNRASIRGQAEQAAALLARQEQLQAERRRVDVLDERARIAREIHDVLAHSLGALSIQIQTARALFADLDEPERGLEVLATAQRMAVDGLTETRRAVLALRTDPLPLYEELARAADGHAKVHGVAVRCVVAGTVRPVPPDATIALLRTARECLVNAAKHAPGRAVGIALDHARDAVRLTVTTELAEGTGGDTAGADGPPDTSPPGTSPGDAARTDTPQAGSSRPGASRTAVLRTVDGGYGLTGIRERLRLLRGSLDVGVRGSEWIVAAELPLTPHPSPERPETVDR